MKFKPDENFGTRTARLFEEAGHDVQTVYQEALRGASDQHLIDVGRQEDRCLVSLDLDFADTVLPLNRDWRINLMCPVWP